MTASGSQGYGASIRAIEDEELLNLHLIREAVAFERRFRETASSIEDKLLSVAHDVDRLGGEVEQRLDHLRVLTDDASSSASDSMSLAEEILSIVNSLPGDAEIQEAFYALHRHLEGVSELTWLRVRGQRTRVWFLFSHIVKDKANSPTWQRVTRRLRRFLEEDFSVADYIANRAELAEWDKQLLDGDAFVWSARRWETAIKALRNARTSGLSLVTDPSVVAADEENLDQSLRH